MNVHFINKSDNPAPSYETGSSAGMDIRAFCNEPVTLQPMERKIIPTGLYMQLPVSYEAQIRPRSGLAAKSGITVLNTPGTIDADYRGEIRIILINMGKEPFTINSGDRIAQMVIAKHEHIVPVIVDSLDETTRGAGGFGHTGVK